MVREMVAINPSRIGVGVYSIPQAAHLIGAPPQKVRRWLDKDNDLVTRAFDPSEQTISFAELMELHFIKLFRDEGVSLQAIRKASKKAAAQFNTAYPFAVKRFDTDGRTIFATLAKECDDEELLVDLEKGQCVFSTILRPFFRKLDYDSADISRYWPLTKKRRVVIDPTRRFGEPIDPISGIPTSTLYKALNAGKGQSMKEVAKWFDVPVSAVRAAAEFERSLK